MAEFERALKEAVEPELKVVVPPPLPRPAKPKPKKRWWVKPLGCLAAALLVLIVCVGGPTAAVMWVIDMASVKFKDIKDAQAQSDAEWEAITAFWPSPAPDARPETLLPQTFGDGRYRKRVDDTDVADAELGIMLPGRRGIYAGPDGDVEVRFYRCPEAEAKAIQKKAMAFVRGRQNETVPAAAGSKRKKVVYTAENSGVRTVTFGFHDESMQHQEYGKLWHGGGWLYWFRTSQPMTIESFPSKFLMEVGKRASAKQ
jgi:hypothetical protein